MASFGLSIHMMTDGLIVQVKQAGIHTPMRMRSPSKSKQEVSWCSTAICCIGHYPIQLLPDIDAHWLIITCPPNRFCPGIHRRKVKALQLMTAVTS